MSNALIESISGLTTAVLWGAGDWLTPRSKQKLGTLQINFVVNFAGAVIFALVVAATLPKLPSFKHVIDLSFISILIGIGYLLFVKALTIGDVGVIVPFSSIYPLLTLLLLIVFKSASYGVGQITAMVIIIMGAILLAYDKKDKKLSFKSRYEAILFTAAAIVFWGVGFFFLNPLIPKVQWEILLFIMEAVSALFALILIGLRYRSKTPNALKAAFSNKIVVAAGSILGLGSIALYSGAGKVGNIIIPATISSLSPLLSALLGAILDKEKLGYIKRAGALLAVAGIVILNL